MSKKKQIKMYVGDFETTVYEGQENTLVWASAITELFTDKVIVLHSIDETLDWCKKQHGTIRIYYHNLSFDGSFWLYFLKEKMKFKQQYIPTSDDNIYVGKWCKEDKLKSKEYTLNISDRGVWYSLIFKIGRVTVELYDSLKLLPFSVKAIGKAFNTKHQKLDMDYEGIRYPGCEITKEEEEYIKNDVLVVKEALEIMMSEGHNKMTIGACCLGEYKKLLKEACHDFYLLPKPKDSPSWFRHFFPDLDKINLDTKYATMITHIRGAERFTVDKYIRHSYFGGWTYVVPEKVDRVIENGLTADVNSLYPSMMHSKSGNVFPYGHPKFWKGNAVPSEAMRNDRYFFVRFKCRFYIKENYLPFVHIRNDNRYRANVNLTTSDVYNKKTGKYERYTESKGVVRDTIQTMTMTCTDFKLFLEHYNVEDFEILDGCYFKATSGLFDSYIDKYAEIKAKSKGAKRTLAKLFLNNLYGKFASSTESDFKVPITKDDGLIAFFTVIADDKEVGYIPVGSAITSYARNFTIRHAQMNYYGPDKAGFIYADTDSIHCDLKPEELVGIDVHPTDLCCWKLETYWDKGIFVRQKTYIEHVTHEDEEPLEIDKQYYNIKGAGMPRLANEYLNCALQNGDKLKQLNKTTLSKDELVLPLTNTGEIKKLDEVTYNWIVEGKQLTDYKVHMTVPSGNLKGRFIKGGKLLIDGEYTMKDVSL